MADKVRGGTTTAARLCDSCSHSLIYQGEDSKEYIYCSVARTHRVPVKVVRCSDYSDKRVARPSLRQMEDMAFILTESGPLKNIGFVHSRDWKKANADKDIIPPDKKGNDYW